MGNADSWEGAAIVPITPVRGSRPSEESETATIITTHHPFLRAMERLIPQS
jgi:hypothetical protein